MTYLLELANKASASSTSSSSSSCTWMFDALNSLMKCNLEDHVNSYTLPRILKQSQNQSVKPKDNREKENNNKDAESITSDKNHEEVKDANETKQEEHAEVPEDISIIEYICVGISVNLANLVRGLINTAELADKHTWRFKKEDLLDACLELDVVISAKPTWIANRTTSQADRRAFARLCGNQ